MFRPARVFTISGDSINYGGIMRKLAVLLAVSAALFVGAGVASADTPRMTHDNHPAMTHD
jgi:hypothetical protein